MSLQALRRYPLRTAMMLLAIAIGVAAVVLLTAVGEGARRYVTGQFSSLGTELLIVLPGRAETAGGGIQGLLVGETARELTLDDTIAHRAQPANSPRHAARARRRHGVVAARASATSRCSARAPRCSRSSTGSWAPAGSCPKATSTSRSPSACSARRSRASCSPGSSPLGEWLRIGDARCRVLGVLAEQGLAGGFNVDETVIMPVASAQQIFNTSAVFRILVEANDRDSVEAARRDIIEIVKARHAGEEDITVVTQDALVSTFDTIFDMITAGLAAIAAISLVVAGVLIMNVMLVAVSQRTGGDRPVEGHRCAQRPDPRAVPDGGGVPVAARRGRGHRARRRRHLAHEDPVPGARLRSARRGRPPRRSASPSPAGSCSASCRRGGPRRSIPSTR